MASAAQEMALKQREISISQFFEKNRHLLGFDNKRKALMTTIKEAVDNSLDACEEARILPEVSIEVIDMGNDRYRVIVEDNGPGIVKAQIPKIFAKLLYGSKFFKLSQSRGQQGIGISASVLYAQLTTGKPAKILSKTGKNEPCHYYELHIDTQHNAPEIVKDETRSWEKEHGVRIELELEGDYVSGTQSVDEYLKETAIANPHVTIVYTNPKAQQIIFPRAVSTLPPMPAEIKPHPYGIELGIMQKMLKDTESRTLQLFLSSEFSRVGSGTAKQICENASLLPNTKPGEMSREMVEKLMEGIKKTKLIAPPTDCISPIGAEQLEKGLRKEVNAEFYATASRRPSVYRGNPFVVEAGIAYGGSQGAEDTVRLLRLANRVPLLYQQGACAITKSVISTAWKDYGLNQSRGALPIGPVTLVVHLASVWVPFTSESKEAIAHYPEIVKEVKLALQEVGRNLASYVSKKRRVQFEGKKRDYIRMFIPHVGEALKELIGLKQDEEKKVEELLATILESKRGELEKVEMENPEYDEEFAKIGSGEDDEDQ
ncbi:MAG TPA: DNA topoisomerase VI subunit B [Candidatus Nanoarchaeia archaeon]|nr:DNA topoisomerase VI subunit B [Candidatus Nanoarchaeia archaeon]